MNTYAAYHVMRGGVDPTGTTVEVQSVEARRSVKVWWWEGSKTRSRDDGSSTWSNWSQLLGTNYHIGDLEAYLQGTITDDGKGNRTFATVDLDWPETNINDPFYFWDTDYSVKGTLSSKVKTGKDDCDECVIATVYFSVAIDDNGTKATVGASRTFTWRGIEATVGADRSFTTKKELVRGSIRMTLQICTDGTSSTKAERSKDDRYAPGFWHTQNYITSNGVATWGYSDRWDVQTYKEREFVFQFLD